MPEPKEKQICKGAGRKTPCSNLAEIDNYCTDCARTIGLYVMDSVRRHEMAEAGPRAEVHNPSVIDYPRCTDTGNAIRFAQMWYEEVLYVPEADAWWVWNGKVWQEDKGNIQMLRMAKLTIRHLFLTAAKQKDTDLRDAELKWAKTSEGQARLVAMIQSSKSTCRTFHYADFDKDPWLFNAANAAIDLRTGKAREHERADYATKISPVEWNPQAKAPRWEQFLREIMPGHEDCCISFLQRAVGYTLTAMTSEECFFVPWGSGRNGKTKLIEAITYVMGDYAKVASFDTFIARKGDEKLNDIAGFRGARLIVASESEHSKRLAEAKIKRMTGGDSVVGEFKYQEQFSYIPTYKIWLVSNYKPRVVGTDDGIWDRTHLIPFTEYFGDDRKDPLLGEKLKAEASGILNWMIEGAIKWAKEGLGVSHCVKEATGEYRKEQNVLGQFLEDRCVLGEFQWVTKGTLYKAYKEWAEQMSEFIMPQTEFTDRMKMQFEEGRTGQRGRHWKGVGLRPEYNGLDFEQEEELVKAIQ
jgi:putative DNA primase/helicase